MFDDFDSYFDQYAAAFNAFDSDRLTPFFHCPCLMVSGSAVALLGTPEAVGGNLEALLRYHESKGFGHA